MRHLRRHGAEVVYFSRLVNSALDATKPDCELGVEHFRILQLHKGLIDTRNHVYSRFENMLAKLNYLSGGDGAPEWVRR